MILQDFSVIMDALLAGGMILLGVLFVVMILMIIVALKVWKWAIEKFGGSVESLGQVFVTLLLAAIADGILGAIINIAVGATLVALLPPQYAIMGTLIVALIVGIIIFPLVVSKRHNMSFGSALVAWIVVSILLGLIVVLIAVIILFAFLGGLALFM